MTPPTPVVPRWSLLRRALRRRVLARRRLLAALCVGTAAAASVHAVAAPTPATVPVVAAAHDLPAGRRLEAGDLRVVPLPPEAVPEGVAADPASLAGQTLAAAVRAGEPVSDVRLLGEGLASAHPELATVPLRLPDPELVALLSPGDRIDLLATDPQAGESRLVATDALVLAVPPGGEDDTGSAPPGAVVVLGVDPLAVTAVSEAGARWFLTWSFSR